MVYLDRHLIRTGGLGGDPAALNELAKAFDVAAIEIYRSAAEIPPQFNGPNAGCGVIVMWTKQGRGGLASLPHGDGRIQHLLQDDGPPKFHH